jgi:Holliday junction resolvasome RuvABC ATP-dependent DNA helicase subunit
MNYYENLIGQNGAKNILSFYLDSYKNTRVFPHVLLVAPKGAGKTEFARETGRILRANYNVGGEDKRMIEVNSSTVTSPKAFVESLVVPYLLDKPCTLFFDEAHEIVPKLTATLLTILNPSRLNKNRLRYGDMEFHFDFTKLTFIFATTDRQKMFEPLVDRMTQVCLIDYDDSEIAEIMKSNMFDGLTADDDALLFMANHSRGNGRDAAKLGGQEGVSSYLSGLSKKHFTIKDAHCLVNILGRFRLGLSLQEVRILQAISFQASSSLTQIASKSGLSRPAQQDLETYLLKHGLIEIDSSRRKITACGQNYLKQIHQERGV